LACPDAVALLHFPGSFRAFLCGLIAFEHHSKKESEKRENDKAQ
jgi:hypothetical protein